MTRIPAAVIAEALGQFPPTPEQTAVIEAPLTPALVVAGAGSGKTETMASRVVWLVANGLVRRDEVLGLTFTRKAAGELAERIQSRLQRLSDIQRQGLLPLPAAPEGEPEASDIDPLLHDSLLIRPTVATYNSFADGVVREHAVRIGRDAEAAVLPESVAWLLMRRVVLESDDPRLEERPEALRTIVDAALRIARDSVDNIVDLDRLEQFAADFADVRERPSTRKGTTVYADVDDAVHKVGALALLVDLARAYNAEKRRLGVIDYADQVAGALQIAHGHAAVVAELQQRYRVVLLDEYQDTSVVQTDLLAALFGSTGEAGGTAVMAVGDPHQAIYGWRGASAGNLGGFRAAFAGDGPCGMFALSTSWRNSGRVLDAANAVLAPLAADAAVPVQPLRPRPGAPGGEVDIVFEADLDAEADRVAAWFAGVRETRRAERRSTTGAILFRSKKHMVRFGEALGQRGIPHRILGLGGLLSTPEVVDVVAALRVICDPTAGSALIRLLSGPRWAIGLADLRVLAHLARRIATHDAALQPLPAEVAERVRTSAGDEQGSLIDALDFVLRHLPEHGWLAGFTPAARSRLREAAAVFDGLRRASSLPIPELVRLIELELRLDIELASNETRGPARTASAQLRAFVDELHAFLATDESGSLPSLLAWLDHAERLDEFAPRTEPPEDDVVQLLTIHGAKGLEWDAVAVVRLVADELPTRPKDTKGWLSIGVLPYAFRGDAAWLPHLPWSARDAPTQQDLMAARARFIDANKARQLAEETRLAYVAVTRARDHLLLTGSSWSGTKKPRARSPFLEAVAAAIGVELPGDDPGDDPYTGARRLLSWPIDPLGARGAVVARAADAVTAAEQQPEPEPDVALLLSERDARHVATAAVAPVRIPASRYKDYVADYAGTAARIARPMPERPYAQTRLGTLFHAWVEERSGLSGRGGSIDDGLWESDDEIATEAATHDAARLAELKAAFERSEWATLRPIAVETEIDVTDTTLDGTDHVIVCKLDAVYRRGERIEIVDWKTGRPPRTDAEKEERMLQLELYRRAYSAKHGVPADLIDVALFYVGDDLVLRG
ncbi:MAG: UvrD-helicase domain-containing protein [Microbacterium sp.]|uniref:UvrD-helicase domain-containing protein n=1 Tax=Microbacterium sp. TaxID=51671 RepID=UPI003A8639F9